MGPLLREFGLAALMHDIGKVRTPLEILNKPDKLTDDEFTIMKRHTVDGARDPEKDARHPDARAGGRLRAPPAARRHAATRTACRGRRSTSARCCAASPTSTMRCDRSAATSRRSRPIASSRCSSATTESSSISTSCGASSSSSASTRLGNLVRLNTGEIAVVLKVNAPDPYRPQVRVLIDRDGKRLELPYELNLWETTEDPERSVLGRRAARPGPLRDRPACC